MFIFGWTIPAKEAFEKQWIMSITAPFVRKGYNYGLYLYSYPDMNAFVCSVNMWIFLIEVQHFIYKNSLSIKTNVLNVYSNVPDYMHASLCEYAYRCLLCVCVCVCVRAFLNVYVYLCEMATDEKGYEGS